MHATPSFGDKSWADFGFSLGYCFCGVYEYGIGGNACCDLSRTFYHSSKKIKPQEDSRTNSPEMKELLGYMTRHHEDLEKNFSDEQKETFEKFHDCWSE